MDLKITIHGLDRVIQKLENYEKIVTSPQLFEYLAKKSIRLINEEATKKLQYSNNYVAHNKYELINNGVIIYNDVQNVNGMHYSLIIEYGSGVKAEGEHIGTTSAFQNSGNTFWYVRAEEVDLSQYGYATTTYNDTELYRVYGQEPKHIYTDAKAKIRKNINKWLNEYIKLAREGK